MQCHDSGAIPSCSDQIQVWGALFRVVIPKAHTHCPIQRRHIQPWFLPSTTQMTSKLRTQKRYGKLIDVLAKTNLSNRRMKLLYHNYIHICIELNYERQKERKGSRYSTSTISAQEPSWCSSKASESPRGGCPYGTCNSQWPCWGWQSWRWATGSLHQFRYHPPCS